VARRKQSLAEMILHPFSTLNKIAGLDRLPDRRVSKRRTSPDKGLADPLDPLRRGSRVTSIYKALGIYALEESRPELYQNFREMDSDAMISAVLDAFGEDAAQKDPEHKRIVWVESPNEDVRKIVTATLDRLKIDQWAFPIMRALARDGDVFFHIAPARGQGVVAIRPYEPWVVARIEDDIGRLVGFSPANEQGIPSQTDKSSVPHYRCLHFRLPPRDLTDHYGAPSSFLWGSRIVWRELQLMEDQVVMQRLLRRPDRLMVLMDATGMTHDEVWTAVKDYERYLYRETYTNPDNGVFASMGTPMDIAKDIVLPRGLNNQTAVQPLPATNTNDLLRDLDMKLAHLAAGIGFPLGFVGRGDSSGYQAGQSLSRQYQPFAKRANRLQNAFLPEIVRLCMIDLAFKNMDPMLPQNAFTLNMATVFPIQEIERNEVIQLKTDRVERSIALGEHAYLNPDIWVPVVLEKYGGLSHDLIKRMYVGKKPLTPGEPYRFPTPIPPPMPLGLMAGGQNENGNGKHEAPILDEKLFFEQLSEEISRLRPPVEDTVRKSSASVQAVDEEKHPWRPKGVAKGLVEGAGDPTKLAKDVEDKLLEGGRLSEQEAKLATESMREKYRTRAKNRVRVIDALIGMGE